MRVQIVIQHDPRRSDLLPGLLAAIPSARVISDPDPDSPTRSPWRCYRACLEALERDATHLLIVQDDAEPCRDFEETVTAIVTAHPSDPVCLFVPGLGNNQRLILAACYRDERYARLDPNDPVCLPVVATVWPRPLIAPLLEYAARMPPSRRADDGITGEWSRQNLVPVIATVPSLVEHRDLVPSLVGTSHYGGINPARVAACWIGQEMTPLQLDWR